MNVKEFRARVNGISRKAIYAKPSQEDILRIVYVSTGVNLSFSYSDASSLDVSKLEEFSYSMNLADMQEYPEQKDGRKWGFVDRAMMSPYQIDLSRSIGTFAMVLGVRDRLKTASVEIDVDAFGNPPERVLKEYAFETLGNWVSFLEDKNNYSLDKPSVVPNIFDGSA